MVPSYYIRKGDINSHILIDDTECNTIDDLHGYTPEYNLKIKYNDIIKDLNSFQNKQARNKKIRNQKNIKKLTVS